MTWMGEGEGRGGGVGGVGGGGRGEDTATVSEIGATPPGRYFHLSPATSLGATPFYAFFLVVFVLVRGLALVLALVFGSLFFVVSLLVFKYGVLSRLRPLQFAFFYFRYFFMGIFIFFGFSCNI